MLPQAEPMVVKRDENITFKTFLVFFVPLILMTEVHQITHSVVHAFLARLTNPKQALAAFSIAFAFNITIASVNQAAIQWGISFITDRRSFWKVFRFSAGVAILLFAVMEIVALTSLGDLVFGEWMGASPEVVGHARRASSIMAIWVFPIFIRNILYAVVMLRRRTTLITIATTVRVGSLALFLLILPFWLDGAAVGAAAMVCCMSLETIFMVFAARSFVKRLKPEGSPLPGYGDIWRFSWPLMITQSAENGVALSLAFFLGRLENPDLALAGFGVVYGLVRVVLAPIRNLTQTAQALTRSRHDLKPMFYYGLLAILFFVGVVILLFLTPLRQIILEKIMGLNSEINLYVTPGVRFIFLVAVFWGHATLLRGLLSAMRQTRIIAMIAGLRLTAVALVGCTTLSMHQANGTVVGVVAIAAGFATETLFLGLILLNHIKSSHSLFPHLEAE